MVISEQFFIVFTPSFKVIHRRGAVERTIVLPWLYLCPLTVSWPHTDTHHADTHHIDTHHIDTYHTDTLHTDVHHTDTHHIDAHHIGTHHADTYHTDTPYWRTPYWYTPYWHSSHSLMYVGPHRIALTLPWSCDRFLAAHWHTPRWHTPHWHSPHWHTSRWYTPHWHHHSDARHSDTHHNDTHHTDTHHTDTHHIPWWSSVAPHRIALTLPALPTLTHTTLTQTHTTLTHTTHWHSPHRHRPHSAVHHEYQRLFRLPRFWPPMINIISLQAHTFRAPARCDRRTLIAVCSLMGRVQCSGSAPGCWLVLNVSDTISRPVVSQSPLPDRADFQNTFRVSVRRR